MEAAVAAKLPVTLVITKVDRLITELKLPPADAYYKLVHTIEEVNGLVATASQGMSFTRLSPLAGNVCFASGLHSWCASLESFAKVRRSKPPSLRSSVCLCLCVCVSLSLSLFFFFFFTSITLADRCTARTLAPGSRSTTNDLRSVCGETSGSMIRLESL